MVIKRPRCHLRGEVGTSSSDFWTHDEADSTTLGVVTRASRARVRAAVHPEQSSAHEGRSVIVREESERLVRPRSVPDPATGRASKSYVLVSVVKYSTPPTTTGPLCTDSIELGSSRRFRRI